MGYRPFRNRIDQALSSLGDGTGVTDLNVAGISITGATTASPVVCTAASHGLSDGEWVFIDGATGTTEINGVRKITNKDTNTFELLDEAGAAVNSAGTFGGTTDLNRAAVIKPATGQTFHITRLNGMAADASAPVVDGMLGVARLSNGIYIKVWAGLDATFKTLTTLPVKGWRDWALYCGGADAPLSDIANTKLESGFRWTFTRNAEGTGNYTDVTLNGDNGDFLVLYSQDDLDGLTAFRVMAQGLYN